MERQKPTSQRVTLRLPNYVLDKTDEEALKQNCSRSGVMVEALMRFLSISQKELDDSRGYNIPKEFHKRTGEWTPNKEKEGENAFE